MRILFVAPYPLSRIRTRSYGFVHQLSKMHDITALVLCSSAREAADVQALQTEGIQIIAVVDKRVWRILRALRALVSKEPLQVAFDAAPALRKAIQNQLTTGHFDLLHVEFIRTLGALPDPLTIPAVWDAVDCISLLYEHGARFAATPMLHLLGAFEARRVRAYEQTQLGRFRHVLVTAERDRQALQAIGTQTSTSQPHAQITVLSHGIDEDYFRSYHGERAPGTLVFSGKMSFHANIAGALCLVKQIMPLIWQKRPDVKLVITGSKPSASIRRLARDPRIQVTGYVSDMRPYIAQAYIAVCPLPYAVGIQNKILEAMALGTPVVASSHAAAGLLATAGRDLLVADQPTAFADAVLHLLADHDQWQHLSQNGLAYITANHNWAQIVKQLTVIYHEVVDTSAYEEKHF